MGACASGWRTTRLRGHPRPVGNPSIGRVWSIRTNRALGQVLLGGLRDDDAGCHRGNGRSRMICQGSPGAISSASSASRRRSSSSRWDWVRGMASWWARACSQSGSASRMDSDGERWEMSISSFIGKAWRLSGHGQTLVFGSRRMTPGPFARFFLASSSSY